MIDTLVLRRKIINLAIQGKLTKQLPLDGDAETLYSQIQKEKAKLIKEGKIRKEKPLPDITQDEIPFEIPKNWKWVRWGELSDKIQYGYNAPAKASGRIKMVRISDIQDGKVQWDTVPYCDIEESEVNDYLLRENNILFARTGGTVGKSYFVTNVPEEAVFAGYLIRTSYSQNICASFMKYFMDSDLYWKQLREGTIATAQPNCNGKTLSKMIVPFPPFAEQKRISEIIENAFLQIDIIDSLQRQYESNLSVLKGKIIDAGIRGRLTMQLPEDGDANDLYSQILKQKSQLIKEGKIKKEKALPDITQDEIPFEIPKSWKWVRWGELSEKIQYGYNAPAKQTGRIKMVRISDIHDGKVQWDTVPYCDIEEKDVLDYLLRKDDILFARTGGTVGKSYIVTEIPEDSIFAGYLIRTSYSSSICASYMKYFMESALYWKQLQSGTTATAQPNCNGKTLSKMIVPFPPYSEQRRISNKIDELLEIIS